MTKKYVYNVINRQTYFTNKRWQIDTRGLTSSKDSYSKTYLFLFFIAVKYIFIPNLDRLQQIGDFVLDLGFDIRILIAPLASSNSSFTCQM